MSNQEESQKKEESREATLASFKRSMTDEIDKFFDESTIEAQKQTKPKAPPKRLDVTGCGLIQLMTMPPGWTERTDESKPDSRFFHHPNQPECEIEVSTTFRQVGEDEAGLLSESLKHVHYFPPSELKRLSQLLGEKVDQQKFRILIAAIKEIAGKKVFLIEGRFVESETDQLCVFFDFDGTAKNLQTFQFSAPRKLWPVHYAKVKAVLKSIKWQGSS